MCPNELLASKSCSTHVCVCVYQETFTSSTRINMHEVFIVCTVCHAAWYRQSAFLFVYTENMALIMASVLCHLYSYAYISGSVDGDQKDVHTIYAVQYVSWTTLALIRHLLGSCYHAVVN